MRRTNGSTFKGNSKDGCVRETEDQYAKVRLSLSDRPSFLHGRCGFQEKDTFLLPLSGSARLTVLWLWESTCEWQHVQYCGMHRRRPRPAALSHRRGHVASLQSRANKFLHCFKFRGLVLPVRLSQSPPSNLSFLQIFEELILT